MSIEAVKWVLERATVRGAAWQVLVVLAEHAATDGTNAFPSRQRIAVQACLSEKAVHEALDQLQANGFIRRAGTAGPEMAQTVNWTVVLDPSQPKKLTRAEQSGSERPNREPRQIQSSRIPPTDGSPPTDSSRGTDGRTTTDVPEPHYRRSLPHLPTVGQTTKGTVNEPPCSFVEAGLDDGILKTSSEHGPVAEPEPAVDPGPDVRRLCQLLAELICERDPRARSRIKPDSKRWLDSMRLLIADRDGDVAEVERVLRWSQQDEFWRSNILSPTKLREKFVQLRDRVTFPTPRRGGSPGQRAGAHPAPTAACDGGSSAAAAALNEIVRNPAITARIPEPWLVTLHAHRIDAAAAGGTLVLGIDPGSAQWFTSRFLPTLVRLAGRPIRLIACDGRERSAAA